MNKNPGQLVFNSKTADNESARLEKRCDAARNRNIERVQVLFTAARGMMD